MRKNLSPKLLIFCLIFALILSGCNISDTPIVSSSAANSEKTPQSSEITSSQAAQSESSSETGTSTSSKPSSQAATTSSEQSSSQQNSSKTSSVPYPEIKSGEVAPIVFTDSLQGESIDLKSQAINADFINKEWTSHFAVVNTYDELEAIWQSEAENIPKEYYSYFSKDDYTKMYQREFFEKNSLIMLLIYGRSVSYPQEDNTVTVSKQDNKLYIKTNLFYNPKKRSNQEGTVTTVSFSDSRTFITIPKDVLSDIDAVFCIK